MQAACHSGTPQVVDFASTPPAMQVHLQDVIITCLDILEQPLPPALPVSMPPAVKQLLPSNSEQLFDSLVCECTVFRLCMSWA